MGILRMLTDRGTEFCGKAEQHDYELFLAINEVKSDRCWKFMRGMRCQTH
jgi:hypothetical protein